MSDELTIIVVDTQFLTLLERLHSGIGGQKVVLANTTGLALYNTVGSQGRRKGEEGGVGVCVFGGHSVTKWS